MKINRQLCLIVLCSLAISAQSREQKSFALPRGARVVVGAVHAEPATADALRDCRDFKLTTRGVRTLFATYKVLTGKDVHDFYAWTPCYLQGTVAVGAATFFWKARPGHLLETDYPDHKPKTLGGEKTEDPSGN